MKKLMVPIVLLISLMAVSCSTELDGEVVAITYSEEDTCNCCSREIYYIIMDTTANEAKSGIISDREKEPLLRVGDKGHFRLYDFWESTKRFEYFYKGSYFSEELLIEEIEKFEISNPEGH